MRRDCRFDNLKVLLMMLVVFQHAFVTFVPHSLNMRAAMSFCFLACTMPLFMLISGYFSKTEINWRKWNCLFVVCLCFNELGNLVAYLLGFSSSFDLFKVAPVMWYLWCLLIYRLLLPMLSKLNGALWIVLGLSWAACLLPVNSEMRLVGRTFGFFPFFYIGYVLKIHPDIFKSRYFNILTRGGGNLLALSLFMVIGVAFAFWGGHPQFVRRIVTHVYLGGGLRMLLECVFAQGLAMVLGFLLLRCVPKRQFWFTQYGRNTLSVYLLHIYIVFLFAVVIRYYGLVQWWYKYPIMFGSIALSAMLFSVDVNGRFDRLLSWAFKVQKGKKENHEDIKY